MDVCTTIRVCHQGHGTYVRVLLRQTEIICKTSVWQFPPETQTRTCTTKYQPACLIPVAGKGFIEMSQQGEDVGSSLRMPPAQCAWGARVTGVCAPMTPGARAHRKPPCPMVSKSWSFVLQHGPEPRILEFCRRRGERSARGTLHTEWHACRPSGCASYFLHATLNA